MGFFSDIWESLSSHDVHAEAPPEPSDQNNTSAYQSGQSTTRGGASLRTPASGTEEESAEEAEVNKEDAAKKTPSENQGQGHKPGDGGEASGQVGPEGAGPHGGPVKAAAADDSEDGDDEEDAADEEEEEEEEEPEDPKPKLEEECANSKQCAPAKHHYDHCVERVTQQIEDEGKAKEDCVEEFFHLVHCASSCAAPKLFSQLK